MKYFVGLIIAVWMGAGAALAEPLDYYLVEGVSYDQTIPKPHETLGHDIGDQPVRHDLMVSYLRQLAEASPRISVETIGYSHEKRPILFFVVTSPENHARLEAIRENHLKRTNAKTAKQASDDMPVVTWLNYGVHGAEASGMDASIPTLYHLAAAQDDRTKTQLENSVILITAVFNPDGHARRGAWVTQYGSDIRNSDPASEIHNQIWPGGRTNHYMFDLNRQWLLQTQPESRAWLAKWHQWKPEVSADFHEMGTNSTYYFHPGVPTRTYPLIPEKGDKLAYELAGYHVKWLDGQKKLYFSQEGFDNYYIGKGSTYPQVNGSLGFLFEAGAQMGIAKESDQGLKTYAENVQTHVGTSLSTIEGAASMREKLHAYQRQFFKDAPKLASDDDVKAYVFRAPEDSARLDMFLDLMARHKVLAYKVKGSVKSGGRSFGKGSYIVPMDQPQYRMAKALFNRITEFPDKVFYDVSGWTLPLAYGLDYGPVTNKVSKALGAAATDSGFVAPEPDIAPYAYVFRWSDYYAPRALNALLEAGILARVSKEPIRIMTTRGKVSLARGAVIVSKHHQQVASGTIDRLMKMLAAENRLTVHAVTSGRTLDAGADLGGRNTVADLRAPKPLLVVGAGVTPYDAGEVWHLLDHRMKMPVTLVRRDRLKTVKLGRYTHIILVGGRGEALPPTMKDSVIRWIKAGGTLVAHRQGAKWVNDTLFGRSKDTESDKKKPKSVTRLVYSSKGQKDAEHVIGGAVFESKADLTHPMAFGIVRPLVATNKNSSFALKVPSDPYAQVAVYTKTPLLSGYASSKRLSELAGTPMMTAERMGDGAVILFADNPNFRATYVGAEKLFINALFFSRAFDKSRAGEEADAQAIED